MLLVLIVGISRRGESVIRSSRIQDIAVSHYDILIFAYYISQKLANFDSMKLISIVEIIRR